MTKKSFIDSVEVGKPCSEDWGKMIGNDRVRLCEHCVKDVNNISELTRKDAKRLVMASGGNICIRYIKNPMTKRPMFADQFYQISRRAPGIAAGVMTASMSFSTLAYAQSSAIGNEAPATVTVEKRSVIEPRVSSNDTDTAPKGVGSIAGTITDSAGAVIPNSSVILTNKVTKEDRSTTSNGDGRYHFDAVEVGEYWLTTSADGFFSINNDVEIEAGRDLVTDQTLDAGGQEVMGGMMISISYQNTLVRAVDSQDADEVRALIVSGENVNGKDENYDNITPLFIAVENGNIEIVQMLLDYGAKINIRDKTRQTPIMRLDSDATPALVNLLTRQGAKVNQVDSEGNSALILAARDVNTDVLRALIGAGANVNAANKTGETPLMNAAAAGDVESVRLLLQSGANVNARDKDGDNAWDHANGEEIEGLLVSFGSEIREEIPAPGRPAPVDEPLVVIN